MNKIYLDDEAEKIYGNCDSLNDLALKVKNKIKIDDVILNYVNLRFHNSKRTEQTGIELLIWLRLNGIMNHCVLFSFETIHSLLNRQPKYLIATSKGTSFVQRPFDLNKIDLIELQDKKAEIENLKSCLKAAFDTLELRHRLANIYGLWFLFNTHNHYFPNEKLDFSIFPKEFRSNFNSLQLEISKFLIQKNFSSTLSSDLINKIISLKAKIRNKKPNILYIDDKADLGWAELIKRVLFQNDIQSHFNVLIPIVADFKNINSFKNLVDDVRNRIYNCGNYIDCVFLDLRLADEEGEIGDINNLSGIKLLNAIHKLFPALPIIITTASNKAESVKKVFQEGAEALWTKPGLENIHGEKNYLTEYFELLKYTEQALNKYSTITEKHIVKAQFELSQLWGFNYIPAQLKNIDIILTDTNVWCEKGPGLVKNHKILFLLAKIFNSNNRRFILIDDVLNELFIHTQNRKEVELRKSAAFSIGLIQQYKNDYLVESSFNDVKNAIKESTNYNLQPSKGSGFHIVSNTTKIHSFHNSKEIAEKELNQRRLDGYKPLHADDTFKLLISHFLNTNNNVLFVSNDKKCKIETLNTLRYKIEKENQNWKIPDSLEINKVILSAKSNNNSFCMMISTDVLYEICFPKLGNKITKLELPLPNTP